MNVHLCIEKEDTKKRQSRMNYLIPMKTTLSLILR